MNNKAIKVSLGRDCVVVRPGYNGDRHRDSWVKTEVIGGVIIWTYPDGELIEVQVPAMRPVDVFEFEGWLPSSFEAVR
jgi:hypothetical protein